MTFTQFILTKYPLCKDVDFNSIHTTWGEVLKLHEEYLKAQKGIVTKPLNQLKDLG